MDVYLVDGTYELFRHYFGVPHSTDEHGQEIGAVRGVLASVLSMIAKGATHIGVATDHVIESFRNDLYPLYKTSAGVPADLMSQFPILENALSAMGIVVWPMVDFEADDALAAAAYRASKDEAVDKVIICTPDKDLAQAVVGDRVVQLDRMRNITRNESAIIDKFGVPPKSIPDYLALVGDTADGYPGLTGWGSKTTAQVLSLYKHLEGIPKDPAQWDKSIRGASKLADTLVNAWSDALLYRTLATLRTDAPVFDAIDELRWRGPTPSFESICMRIKAPDLPKRAAACLEKVTV